MFGLTIGALTLGGARASAQGTVLYGCYVPSSGTVYRIKADGLPDACRSTQHVQFTWSLQGPPGPTGPAGPTGPQGAAGPAGGVPAAGVKVATATTTGPIAPGQRGSVVVDCPAGHVATGGGGTALNSAAILRLIRSVPSGTSGTIASWQVEWENGSAASSLAQGYAVCVPAQ